MPRICGLVLLAAWTAQISAVEPEVAQSDLVATQEGRLPIILSAPHGGRAEVPGVPERRGEGLRPGPAGFVTVRDSNTDQLALELSDALEARLGARPYFVVARFSRKFIDVNRPPEIGYEHEQAKPVYDAYHEALDRYAREVQRTFGRGLLLDLHGQSTARDTVFRGTKDGKTVTLLVERFGPRAQNGPQSFCGLLAAQGCKVHPSDDGPERAGFTGGYIVQTYGSHQGHGIDAIQLEFGGDYSDKARLKSTAVKLANAIDAFAKLYLPAKPRGSEP